MTSPKPHIPGQWPVTQPVPLLPAPDSAVPRESVAPEPPVVVPVPDVRLVVTVDLTGSYTSGSQVTADLYEQTRRSSDCHTAIVNCGHDALTHGLGLAEQIASTFFLSAQRIEVHVPAGTRNSYLAAEVRRHLALMCADHAQMLNRLRAAS
ncbi:hypothetical protein R1T08_24285 [Streptomyces sp. SBC-4]|nr:hypothetical protein [Streptomyces sp. SBC-4]MDV5147209.1 hypothetical protein [Streptomyces sp. SBC-4]